MKGLKRLPYIAGAGLAICRAAAYRLTKVRKFIVQRWSRQMMHAHAERDKGAQQPTARQSPFALRKGILPRGAKRRKNAYPLLLAMRKTLSRKLWLPSVLPTRSPNRRDHALHGARVIQLSKTLASPSTGFQLTTLRPPNTSRPAALKQRSSVEEWEAFPSDCPRSKLHHWRRSSLKRRTRSTEPKSAWPRWPPTGWSVENNAGRFTFSSASTATTAPQRPGLRQAPRRSNVDSAKEETQSPPTIAKCSQMRRCKVRPSL